MKALVLGAGIVGITTAYELNRDGYDVTVIDREAEPASFTSYSNAGLFAPGHAYAWYSPAAPTIVLECVEGSGAMIATPSSIYTGRGGE